MVAEFHDTVAYDALWIDMNEPANFVTGDITDENGCADNNINYPPYLPRIIGEELADKTLCPDTVQHAGVYILCILRWVKQFQRRINCCFQASTTTSTTCTGTLSRSQHSGA